VKWIFQKPLKVIGSHKELGNNKERAKMVRRSVFEKIFREMQSIHFRLDDLEKNLSGWSPPPVDIPEADLFSLSDHLRKTYMMVASTGECDAIQVSTKTGRCRAL
jgi:hypothetical protein